MSIQIFGLPVSRGVAIGRAVLVDSAHVDVEHYFIDGARIEDELLRLRDARDRVAGELEALKRDLPTDAPQELAALLDVHQMLLHDPMVIEALRHWVEVRRYNAEWAVTAQTEVLARQFEEMDDEYLRERRSDIEQVADRLLRALARQAPGLRVPSRSSELAGEHPLVLVANDIAPADLLNFKGSVFIGFVTDVGGRTSHTAIVARSMNIPAVVGARESSRLIRQDDWVVIDGDHGVVLVNPSPIVLDEYRHRQRESDLERDRLDRLRHKPSVTMDGQPVELMANIELPTDAAAALVSGAVGVGLFRTEFLFLNRNGQLPGEQEQYEAYRSVVESLRGLPVVIRTVDVGADKPLERMTLHELKHEHILNPALGLRAIRWSLAEPAMFKQQLRAILRASAHGQVRLLIPMVAQLREIAAIHQVLQRAKQELAAEGLAFSHVQVGAMVEVPAAALMAATLLQHFDFLSIGTNDLIQYTLAIDRADESVSDLFDPWHPVVLRMIEQVVAAANRSGKHVSVCGEMAGDTAFTELLIAMGLRSLSMHPSRIALVKQRVLRTDAQRLSARIEEALCSDDPSARWAEILGGMPMRSRAAG